MAISNAFCRDSFLPSRAIIELLEQRSLLSVAVGTALTNTFVLPGAAPTDINLAGTFDVSSIAGPVVRFQTSLGNVDIELFSTDAPRTVQNFANYVANNRYNQTVFDRLTKNYILQGGGYLSSGVHILQDAAIANEYSPAHPNVRGTIAMAKVPSIDSQGRPVEGGGPDSARSDWFINLADNANLDNLDGGYTVFGQVINGTMSTVDAIAALDVYNASAVSPAFSELPVRNTPTGNPTSSDFVFLNSATQIADTELLTLTVQSDDPSIVNPVIANGVLRLNYGTAAGSARITVTATDSTGAAATQTFVAGVGELEVKIGGGGVSNRVDFTEADGGRGSVSIAGGGTALIRFVGDGLTLTPSKVPTLAGSLSRISRITTIDTGVKTTLQVNSVGGDGAVEVSGVEADGPLGNLNFKSVRLSGNSQIGGTVRTATVGSMAGASLTFGGAANDGIQLAFSVGSAVDSNMTSGMPIKSLKATQWTSSSDFGTVTAPFISSVSAKTFEQSLDASAGIRNIKVSGNFAGNITADSVGKITAGTITGGVWNLSQAFAPGRLAVGRVQAKGEFSGTTIRAASNIGVITAGRITSGRVYAGVEISDEEFPPFLPTTLTQFTNPARINQVTTKGGTQGLAMAATVLGKLNLGVIGTDSLIEFGLAATQISQLNGRTAVTEIGGGLPIKLKNLDDQTAFDAATANLGLGNFVVVLF